MREQFNNGCRCPLCGSQNVKSVRTREKTYRHCHECRDVWREPQAIVRAVHERRRSTDYSRQATTKVA